jgi:hypothetical protein
MRLTDVEDEVARVHGMEITDAIRLVHDAIRAGYVVTDADGVIVSPRRRRSAS